MSEVVWHFKSDLRFIKDDDEGWSAYSKADSKKIEEAFQVTIIRGAVFQLQLSIIEYL